MSMRHTAATEGIRRCARIGAAALAVLALAGCESGSGGDVAAGSPVAEPQRSVAVPADAVWVGGADGGVYVSVSKDPAAPEDVYRGAVYAHTGDLWYQGRLRLEPPGSPAISPEDADSFSGWDGDTLYLSDGRRLVAADRHASDRFP